MKPPTPLRVLMSGGPGTGKSRTARTATKGAYVGVWSDKDKEELQKRLDTIRVRVPLRYVLLGLFR